MVTRAPGGLNLKETNMPVPWFESRDTWRGRLYLESEAHRRSIQMNVSASPGDDLVTHVIFRQKRTPRVECTGGCRSFGVLNFDLHHDDDEEELKQRANS